MLFACVDPETVATSTAPASSTTQSSTTTPVTADTLPETTTSGVAGLVGMIGCSMTIDAVEGYVRVGGSGMWPVNGLGYGQGAIARWSEIEGDGGFWRSFDAALEKQDATATVWWELCTSGSRMDDLEQALIVLDGIEARLPGATVYVSAQPEYTDGHVCNLAGARGPEVMQQLAAELVETGRVVAGPVLSRLQPSQLVDTCHANAEGKRQMGQELLDFFG